MIDHFFQLLGLPTRDEPGAMLSMSTGRALGSVILMVGLATGLYAWKTDAKKPIPKPEIFASSAAIVFGLFTIGVAGRKLGP